MKSLFDLISRYGPLCAGRIPSLGRLAIMVLTIGPLMCGPLHAALITVDTIIDTDTGPGTSLDGQGIEIEDGDDGPTTVRIIEGGRVLGFHARDNSNVILDGGFVFGQSDFRDLPELGLVSFPVFLSGNAKFTILSGTFACFESICGLLDDLELLVARDQSEFHVYGGLVSGPFELLDSSSAHIYGRNLRIERLAGYDQVIGENLAGETVFFAAFIPVVAPGASIVLHEIPEPTSAVLLVVSLAIFVVLGGDVDPHNLGPQ